MNINLKATYFIVYDVKRRKQIMKNVKGDENSASGTDQFLMVSKLRKNWRWKKTRQERENRMTAGTGKFETCMKKY